MWFLKYRQLKLVTYIGRQRSVACRIKRLCRPKTVMHRSCVCVCLCSCCGIPSERTAVSNKCPFWAEYCSWNVRNCYVPPLPFLSVNFGWQVASHFELTAFFRLGHSLPFTSCLQFIFFFTTYNAESGPCNSNRSNKSTWSFQHRQILVYTIFSWYSLFVNIECPMLKNIHSQVS